MINSSSKRNKMWVTPQADQLAQLLISRMQIAEGATLAPFLELDYMYDNHTAIQQWIQKMLTVQQGKEVSLESLQRRLVATIPAYMQGDLDS